MRVLLGRVKSGSLTDMIEVSGVFQSSSDGFFHGVISVPFDSDSLTCPNGTC